MLTSSVLLFPVTMYYLSPVLSLAGASQNIVTGSVIVFAAQFVASLFLGRLFCGWLCPGGGVQEIVAPVQPKPLSRTGARWIKWIIWVPWCAFLLYLLLSGAGDTTVDFTAFTHGGISLTDLSGYIVYYLVLTAFLVLAFTLGRRAACHTICWISPFMIIGGSIRKAIGLPALHLATRPQACIECSRCSEVCPMSIQVQETISVGALTHSDCILCGECVDVCPKEVISYRFSAQKPERSLSREATAASR